MKFKFGVALSGGGYRAAAFHLGALRYLSKAGLLNRVECFSTVSGGSIIGAAYCLMIGQLGSFEKFEEFLRGRLRVSIIKRVLLSFSFIKFASLAIGTLFSMGYFLFFTVQPWLSWVIGIAGLTLLIKFQFRLFPVSEIIEQIYNNMFYQRAVLTDLPIAPRLVINSTNLQTGRLFYFTRDKISDSTYDQTYEGGWTKVFNNEKFSLAKAVMCSSCVPSFFTPIVIEKELLVDPSNGETVQPVLVDGGIYDNQGIHKLTHPKGEFECETVIVSDAGNKLPLTSSYKSNLLTLLFRTVEVFMTRIKNFQMMANLYQKRIDSPRQIAYITLGWNLDELVPGFIQNLRSGNVTRAVSDAHGLTTEFITNNPDSEIRRYLEKRIDFNSIMDRKPTITKLNLARSVATNLTALSSEQIDALSSYAEVMTEIQAKLYCPRIFVGKIS